MNRSYVMGAAARWPLSMLAMMLMLLLAIACAASAGVGPGTTLGPQDRTSAAAGEPGPGTAWLIFGVDTVRAEVARTSSQRSQGLMGRPEVPAGTGMLFVFDDEEPRSFWMRNTLVALDIAFFDSEFRIVDIQQMEAGSEDFHDSRAPAMYALEVPQGWFASQGIQLGDKPEVIFGR